MKKLLLACVAWSCLSLSAHAHEIWIERDGQSGPVRVYFGEPAEAAAAESEDELGRLQHFEVFGAQGKAGKATRNGDHLVAPLAASGDAWLFDNQVFEPWQGEDKRYEAVSYYARAGRSSTKSRLALELVPTAAQGNTFTATFREKPLADTEISLIDQKKTLKTLKTDAQGRVTLPSLAPGRYIVVVAHKEPVETLVAGKQVETMHHISTLTFASE
ncbi:hypothetical protein ARC20_01520 [Stenotrophomonas panacihumi]|uniref:Nickel uptake transporter family protein n=1 Tax=Stenotrophomonas panacihumi TaxID=676599 RepID=A0A0R0AGI5_9GAMM|nr:DUF4198 domain-containing protein [Stenotrophomonas panacihumi]KRG40449.1 hypothetical protein ARC20_01520 [Stenotrophomonas panacihumi]PTN54400.1 DUF4198 domain-containing protein [Stenotrophomonas panacihumi]